MTKILCIGDGHDEPWQKKDRWLWLGKFLVDKRPDIVVNIGDFITLDSLSAWDTDKRRKMEMRRYDKEIQSGKEALAALWQPAIEYNKYAKRRKKKAYIPTYIHLEGNHEERAERYLDYNPHLEGKIDVYRDLELETYSAKWIKYRNYWVHNGIMFSHIPFQRNGRPLTGQDLCRKALTLTNYSIIFGHSHRFGVDNVHRFGAKHLQQALNIGCYFEHQPDYVEGSPTDYWRGVVVLDNYKSHRFDIQTYSLSSIRSTYG